LKTTSAFHFKISECKRLIIRKVGNSFEVRGELNYRVDTGVFGTIVKRGKSVREASLQVLPLGVSVSVEKARRREFAQEALR